MHGSIGISIVRFKWRRGTIQDRRTAASQGKGTAGGPLCPALQNIRAPSQRPRGLQMQMCSSAR